MPAERNRLSTWKTYNYDLGREFGLIERRGGVYAIYCDGALCYIGQSINVASRITSYRIRFSYGDGILTPWGNPKSVIVKVSYGRRFGDWAMRELRLIRRLRPPQNCVGSTRRRTKNQIAEEAGNGW